MLRHVQSGWVSGVLKRMLDVRGPDPMLRDELQAVFDVTRRDPELCRAMGITRFCMLITKIPGGVGNFNGFQIEAPDPQTLVVVEQVTDQLNGTPWTMSFSAGALAGGGTQSPFDMDQSGVSQPPATLAYPIVTFGHVAALPPANSVFYRGPSTMTRRTHNPIVLPSTTVATGNVFQVIYETANLDMRFTVEGYVVRSRD